MYQLLDARQSPKSWLGDHYLVDGKSNSEKFGTFMALHPSTFLHQRHDDSAEHLPVLWVVVLLIQLQSILRVCPKRVCKTQKVAGTEAN